MLYVFKECGIEFNIGLKGRAKRGPYKGRVPVSRVHVHCSGLFLPRDAAEKFWSFLPGTGFQKRHFCFHVWYPAF